jgi:coenzyme F420-reducing hydrogenase alpha subunit
LLDTHKDVVILVTRIHRLANEMCNIIGGRTTHPIRAKVGHFTMLPTKKELVELKKRLQDALSDLKLLAETFASVSNVLPDFVRETEYLSLTDKKEYAFYDGRITTSDIKKNIPVDRYKEVVNEFVVPQSTAKYGKFNRDSFMVGALARYNNNHEQLTPLCREVAGIVGLNGLNANPYMNNAAQVVECVFAVERSIEHIEALLDKESKPDKPEIKVKAGRGIGAVEVPRGILFHDYTYGEDGLCTAANCVIPTNLNHNNIQKDFEKMVPDMMHLGEKDLRFNLEMLVRAYDPCISCSTHLLDIEFKR